MLQLGSDGCCVKYLVNISSDSLFHAFTAVGLLLYQIAGCSVEGILTVYRKWMFYCIKQAVKLLNDPFSSYALSIFSLLCRITGGNIDLWFFSSSAHFRYLKENS